MAERIKNRVRILDVDQQEMEHLTLFTNLLTYSNLCPYTQSLVGWTRF